jgi:putative lysine transport system permease protein
MILLSSLPNKDAFFETILYLISTYHNYFFIGIVYTLILSIVGTIGGFLISSVFTLLRTQEIDYIRQSRIKNTILRFLHWMIDVYINIFRGTPMMVQAMIFYYGLSRLQLDFWTPMVAGIFVVTLNTTAYLAEILRSGINGISKGQLEASRSLGFSHNQGMIYVVLPQAIRNSLPAITNEFIINLKDTSVLSVIGVTELFRATQLATAPNYRTTEGFFIAAMLYLLLTFFSSRIVNYIEKKLKSDVIKVAS